MLEVKIDEMEGEAKIIVIGVGGAGNNAVDRMIEELGLFEPMPW